MTDYKILFVSDIQPDGSLTNPQTTVSGAIRSAVTAAAGTSLPITAICMAGDLAYNGVNAEYDLTFGSSMYSPVLNILRPAPGNHDYNVSNAANYDAKFTSWGVTHETGSGPPYYYAFDIGTWRCYSLDIQPQQGYPASFAAGSAQYNWAQTDLAAHPNRPIFVYWHMPRWNNGAYYGNDSNAQAMWQLFWDAGCDFIVHGHDHGYERHTRLSRTGSGGYPTTDANGCRVFISATGGYGLREHAPGTGNDPNGTLQAWNDQTMSDGSNPGTVPNWFGYTELILTPATYSSRFVSWDGTVKDAGVTNVPVRNVTGPVTQTAAATLSTTANRVATAVVAGTVTQTATATRPTTANIVATAAGAGPLPAPINQHTTAIGSTSISDAWSAVAGAAGYEIVITASMGTTQATTYIAVGLTPSTVYTMTVMAYDAQGVRGAPSSIQVATTA